MSSLPEGGRHRLYQCPDWHEITREIPRGLQKVGAKKRELQRKSGSGKEVSLRTLSVKANGTEVISASRSGSPRSTRAGVCQQRAFKGHVATDGSLLGKTGKWGACGWAVVQLDYDEEMVSLNGMYGSMEAAFEVQRALKRAELTAFLCLLKECWASQGPCRQQGDYGWITKRRKYMF